MRNLALLALATLVFALSAACSEDAPPPMVNGEFVTYLNNSAQDAHKFSDVELEAVNGECLFDEATGKFSFKVNDGPWDSPDTTYYLEALEVTGNVPKSLRVREGQYKYETDIGTDFNCDQASNEQMFEMKYVEDETTGETYYMLKFNCSGDVNATGSSAIDPMRLTNIKSSGNGIKITGCESF